MITSLLKKWSKDSGSITTGLLYGTINGIMCIPVTISFCTIIYRDKGFETYLPQLVKLVMFSSMIHQLAFTYFSSLPFAIGQVQDAGLIFLSAMASDIVQGCARTDQIVPTTIVVLPICTFLLGGMLMIVAKLKLATVIQYLPMPVIGGYLAFIGFFCGQAGLAMMAGQQVTNISEWGNLFSERSVILLTPGVLFGITTYMLLRNIRSPYVLPACMAGILAIFFSTLLLSGMSLEDAREYGWISPLSVPEPFYESWKLYDFSLVDWSQLPQQLFRLIGMFLVVAFSSSLDVAAIEMEMGLPLDYNRELNTVGIANVLSGLTGGYTGSYIFSQTIFTMRRGVYSRINGYTVAICEGLLILAPLSVLSYLPKMFFGSLLVLISTDLMFEWLVAAREKMADMEYAVCILTFVAIQATGIEVGMFIGILLAMASFVVSYSRSQSVSCASLQTSTVIRTFEERAALIAHRGKVVTITLKGYIFFGSAVKILQDVKSHVSIQVPDLSPQQLMQLQQQQALAEKQALLSGHPEEATESSLLLPAQPAVSYTSGSGVEKSTDFTRLEGPRMSFRLNTSSGSGGKPQQRPHPTTTTTSISAISISATNAAATGSGSTSATPAAVESRQHTSSFSSAAGTGAGSSAAKKLFPDIAATQDTALPPSDAGNCGTEFGAPLGRSSSMPIHPSNSNSNSGAVSTESSFAKPSRGQSFAQALSVYDMSPDTMQRMIEERHRHQGYDHHSEQDTAFFSSVGGTYTSTAREHSTGCINNNNNTTTTSTSSAGSLVGKSAASSYAKRSAPARASPAPQHYFSSAPAPASALLVGAGAGVERGSLLGVADSHGDLEMGKVTPHLSSPASTGRSLLTQRIQNSANPTAAVTAAAAVTATAATVPRQQNLRRQSGDAKIDSFGPSTTSATTASPAAIESTQKLSLLEPERSGSSLTSSISGKLGSSRGNSNGNNSSNMRRRVSFDGGKLEAETSTTNTEAGGAAGEEEKGEGVTFSTSPGNTSYVITSGPPPSSAAKVSNSSPAGSLLATVWEHQAQRRSTNSTNKNNGNLNNGTTDEGAAHHPGNSPPSATLSTPQHQQLHTPSSRSSSSSSSSAFKQSRGDSNDSSSGGEFSLTRERSFREEYSAKKKIRSRSAEKLQCAPLHTPVPPPPEMLLLHSLAADTRQEQQQQQQQQRNEIMTEFLVLDFSAVVGVDATATRSCFLMLVQLMHSADVAVVFANMTPNLEALFRAHKVIGPKDIVIPLLDDALEWCEEQVLISAGHHHNTTTTTSRCRRDSSDSSASSTDPSAPQYVLSSNDQAQVDMPGCGGGSSGGLISPPRNPSFYQNAAKQRQQLATRSSYSKKVPNSGNGSSSSEDLRNTSSSSKGGTSSGRGGGDGDAVPLRRILEDYLEVSSASSPRLQQLLRSELLSRFFRRVAVPAQELLFDVDQLADKIYFIETGEVEIVTVAPSQQLSSGTSAGDGGTGGGDASSLMSVVVRVNKVSAGGAFGEADFLLGSNHSVQAHTMAHSVFWTLDREQYAAMEVNEPSLCLLIQHSLLKSLAIASTCAMYAQHPSTAYSSSSGNYGTQLQN